MKKITDWNEIYDRYMEVSRLTTFPVGIKFFEKREDLPSEVEIKEKEQAFCQKTGQARILGRSVIGVPENADRCSLGAYAMGFKELGEEFKSGRRNLGSYHRNIENNEKFLTNVPHFEQGRWDAFYVAPITELVVEPDIVAFYGFPAQIMRFIQGWVFMNGSQTKALTFGDLACAEVWVAPYQNDEPRIAIPCNGARVFGGTQDYELAFSTPTKYVEDILIGMEAMHASGFRYPITRNILDAEPAPKAAWFIRPENHPYDELGKEGLKHLKKYREELGKEGLEQWEQFKESE